MRFTLSTQDIFKTCVVTHFQMQLKPDKVLFLIVGSGGHEWAFDVVGKKLDVFMWYIRRAYHECESITIHAETIRPGVAVTKVVDGQELGPLDFEGLKVER